MHTCERNRAARKAGNTSSFCESGNACQPTCNPLVRFPPTAVRPVCDARRCNNPHTWHFFIVFSGASQNVARKQSKQALSGTANSTTTTGVNCGANALYVCTMYSSSLFGFCTPGMRQAEAGECSAVIAGDLFVLTITRAGARSLSSVRELCARPFRSPIEDCSFFIH